MCTPARTDLSCHVGVRNEEARAAGSAAQQGPGEQSLMTRTSTFSAVRGLVAEDWGCRGREDFANPQNRKGQLPRGRYNGEGEQGVPVWLLAASQGRCNVSVRCAGGDSGIVKVEVTS